MDGSCAYYFYRIANTYASGGRKRRRIGDQESAHVRWHKTGKTKQVVQNEIHRGFKKIMVLYETLKRGCKAEKSNWVMHQYHLGSDEHEKEGEYVVSKIFHQPKKESEKESEHLNEPYHASCSSRLEDVEFITCLAGNTEAGDFSRPNPLSCNEIVEYKDASNDINTMHNRGTTGCNGIGELENLELDVAPDFNISPSFVSINL